MPWKFFYCLLLLCLVNPRINSVYAKSDLPTLQSRVTDLSGVLKPSSVQQLESELTELEKTKGAQIAVLLIPSTQGEAIEDYAIRLVEKWKLGRKGVDDGILLLVATEDRNARIEVAYGLEGAIPDALAKRILDEQIFPYFKTGDWDAGVLAGVKALSFLVRGEALPPPVKQSRNSSRADKFPLVIFVLFILGAVLRPLFGSKGAGITMGAIASILFWFVLGSLVFAILLGFLSMILTMTSASRSGFSSRGRRGPWGGGGFGGGFGGGGFGGGGFGGGGGSFGGGGASGRW